MSIKLAADRGIRACVLMLVCAAPWVTTSASASAKCQITKVAELSITMNNLRPIVSTKINNKDAKFLLDSGAFYSLISAGTASEYALPLRPAPRGVRVIGIGGASEVSIATVKEFMLVGATIKNVEFLVGGSEVGGAGLLGQNLLDRFDVEYDFANGIVRLFRTEDCENTQLAYWVTPGQSYSAMHIDRVDFANAHTVGTAFVNGKQIKIAFDTGAYTSLLSTSAAARAGIKPDSEGVVADGYSGGIGRGRVKSYLARVANFQIGDGEEIKNTKMRFADIDLKFADMLLGANFFTSHRIFVATKEHRLFLTYNGGPVFDLTKRVVADATADAGDPGVAVVANPADAAAAAEPVQPAAPAAAETPDAADMARRGSALAARGEFGPALADLSKAVELSPNEPEYYFQRANAYSANKQFELALSDYKEVIKLKEDFLPAYIPRAELELAHGDKTAALTDLDAVDRLAAKAADLRFMLAELDQRVDRNSEAAVQYEIWMKYHPDDSRIVAALSGRCLNLAIQNQELSDALSDCNTALRRADKKINNNFALIYVYRGLVRFRQGESGKAIDDFNEALKTLPKNAWALYVRGIAEGKTGKKYEGDRDVAAAVTLAPKITERFQKIGIGP